VSYTSRGCERWQLLRVRRVNLLSLVCAVVSAPLSSCWFEFHEWLLVIILVMNPETGQLQFCEPGSPALAALVSEAEKKTIPRDAGFREQCMCLDCTAADANHESIIAVAAGGSGQESVNIASAGQSSASSMDAMTSPAQAAVSPMEVSPTAPPAQLTGVRGGGVSNFLLAFQEFAPAMT